MKKLIAYLCMMIFVLTSAAQSQTDESKMNRFVSGLMKKMTLEEKVGQLSQCSGGFATGPDNTRISRTEDISKGLIGSLLNVSGAANTRKYQEAADEIAPADSFDFRVGCYSWFPYRFSVTFG